MKIVKKYFIPNEENEYKPHIMREASVAVMSFVILFIFFVGIAQTLVLQKTNFLSAVVPQTLIALANEDRNQDKLDGLSYNVILEQAAQAKANDMASKGYFAHNSPDGKTPWYWFVEAGYKYTSAGENLAINFSDSIDVNQAWMNSPGHRANILNSKFTEIGIATAQGMYQGRETTFVVQMFGRPQVKIAKAVVAIVSNEVTSQVGSSSVSIIPKTQVAVSTNATTSTTTVLSASASNSQKVLNESETFISVQSEEPNISTTQVANAVESIKATWLEKILVSPKKTMNVLYLFIAGFILISLLLMIGIEIKRQHPKHIAYGVGLLILIIVLSYIYRAFIFTQVIVL